MPGPTKDSLFDVIAGSEVTRDTESSREAVLVYQNVGFEEEESELPGSQLEVITTSALASASLRESDQSTPILQSTGQVEEESEVPGSQSQDATTSGPASASSRELDQSTPILGRIGLGQVLSSIREDIEPNEQTKPSEPPIENLPRYENLENLELSNEAISSSESCQVRASTSSRESPILESIGHVEEESEVPGSQSQDVSSSGPASASSRESDQSTSILGSVGQVDQEPNEPTRTSEPPAENLPRYENLEHLESFRVIRQLVPVYQYMDCRAEEPVRFRPQPEEIPIETPCLDFTVNFVLDYWKFILIGFFILGIVIFLIVFFTTSKHGSVAPTFGTTTSFATVTTTVDTVTTTEAEPMQFTISTTSMNTTVADNFTSPSVDGPITSTAAPKLSTKPPSAGCSPITNTTFLFAYSNDLPSSLIQKSLGDIRRFIVNPKITTFANNRLDTTKEDPIHFHASKDDFDKSVNALLPDSKLKLPNTKEGSNVLNMLKKFLEQPTCGAIVYILMKRLPDTVDVTDLIQELRENHISVFPIIDSAYIGSKDQSIMCKLAHSTNGFCDYQIASRLENEVYETMWIVSRVHVFVSQSYQVSGKGSIKVPSFVRPPQRNEQGSMGLVVTYQNHVRDTNFEALSFTIKNDQNTVVLKGQTNQNNGNALLEHPVLKNNVPYQIDINYEYEKTNTVEKIEVRFYSISPPATWIPFPTYQNVSTIRV